MLGFCLERYSYEQILFGKTDHTSINIGILLPKLFWPTLRKKCSSNWEKLLKFKAEGRKFSNFLRSVEEFIQTVKA